MNYDLRCLQVQYIRPWMLKKKEKVAHALLDAADKAADTLAQAHVAGR